jgi:hypothetical protein
MELNAKLVKAYICGLDFVIIHPQMPACTSTDLRHFLYFHFIAICFINYFSNNLTTYIHFQFLVSAEIIRTAQSLMPNSHWLTPIA